jgi:hypothetical protein
VGELERGTGNQVGLGVGEGVTVGFGGALVGEGEGLVVGVGVGQMTPHVRWASCSVVTKSTHEAPSPSFCTLLPLVQT